MVEIYTTNTCTYCVMAKNFMKDQGIEYTEYNISNDDERRTIAIEKYHAQGVPLIVVNDTPVYGFKPDEILRLAKTPMTASNNDDMAQAA